MHSEFESSIYFHTNPATTSDHNNLQYSCNYYPKTDCVVLRVSIDIIIHSKNTFGTKQFQELAKLERNERYYCYKFLRGQISYLL